MSLVDRINATCNDRTVKDYMKEYHDKETSLPDWQRLDKWCPEYKQSLIRSILEGKDIPKLYTYRDYVDKKKYILDGGHRTRCISEFMNNKFSVMLKDKNWYQWEESPQVKPKRSATKTNKTLVLPESLKDEFLETFIQVSTYKDIRESDARQIFNDLNHQRPMTPAEVINSWSSLLVDGLRSLNEQKYDGSDLSYVHKISSMIKNAPTDNHEFMKWMTSMFSIYYNRKIGKSDYYCEPSSAETFIKMNGSLNKKGEATLNTQFNREDMDVMWPGFMNSLTSFTQLLEGLRELDGLSRWKPLLGEAYSIFQWVDRKDSHKLSDISGFLSKIESYRTDSSSLLRIIANGDKCVKTLLDKARGDLDKLKEDLDPNVIEWCGTTQNNPCGGGGMKKRKEFLSQASA